MNWRVAVVGAGASGLVTARRLVEAGADPVVFERERGPGGLWRPDTGLVYPSLRTNTSKEKTAFSDLPFDDRLADFPGGADVQSYLERYAADGALEGRIRFGTAVRAVRPEDGAWSVDGERFDSVIVCSGVFSRPAVPELPGRAAFGGTVVHSSAYRGPEPFAQRDVVVVGAGSSAIDIARELVGTARSVRLAMRTVPLFTPRLYRGRPFDHRATRLARALPAPVRDLLRRRILRGAYRAHGTRLERLLPTYTPGIEVLSELAAGRIVAAPALTGFTAGGVRLADGSAPRADAVILATGYRAEFPFLPDGVPGTVDGALALYRLVFPPGIAGLSFVGLCRVSGPVFPVAELQARWVTAVLAGRVRLPATDVMRAEIASRVSRAREARADPMRVELLDYLDDVASRIGAKPSLLRHPRLLVAPVSARDYAPRLRGP